MNAKFEVSEAAAAEIVTVKLSKRVRGGWSTQPSQDVTVTEAARMTAEYNALGSTSQERFDNAKIGKVYCYSHSGTLTQLANIAQLAKSACYIGGELYVDCREVK